MNKFFFVIGFLIISISIIAQKKEFISVAINGEKKDAGNLRNNIAFSYENQFSNHSGFEIGLSQRRSEEYSTVEVSNDNFKTFHILENYITMPIVYKFNSNVVNLSAGVSLDYFAGWKDVTKFGDMELTGYTINPKFFMGLVMKLSKTIPVSTKLYIEPEIHFNPILKNGFSYFGVSMKLKYRL